MGYGVQVVPLEVQVADPSNANNSDNNITPMLGGRAGEAVVAELHGKYYTQASRGNVFIGSSAYGGVVVPIYSTTAPTFGLWNPSGSGKNAVLISLAATMSSIGTEAVTGLGLGYSTGVGSSIATGAPVTAWNTGAPVNALLGSGKASKMLFSPAGTNTLTAGSTFLMNLGMFIEAATAGNGKWNYKYDFNGTIIVPPSVLIHVVGVPLAPGSTYGLTLLWEEVPIL